ncbi:MAG: hypothetical protein ACI857_001064 [Arenicella sp.]
MTSDATVATFQWIDCQDDSEVVEATPQIFIASSNGSYACIIDNSSCSHIAACSTLSSVGFDEYQNVSLEVFSNPATESFSLIVNGLNGNTSYTLRNIEGTINC